MSASFVALPSLLTAPSRHTAERCERRLLLDGRAAVLSCGDSGGGGGQRACGGTSSLSPASNRRRRVLAYASADASQQAAPPDAVVLDLLLPGVEPAAAAAALFGCCLPEAAALGQAAAAAGNGSGAGLLAQLMQQALGCTDLACEPWRVGEPGASSNSSGSPDPAAAWAAAANSTTTAGRAVRYSMSLSRRQRLLLPLGSAAVPNREEQRLQALPGGGLEVRCRCTSSGVPFADCFATLLHWQLLPAGGCAGTGCSSASSRGLQPGQQRSAAALRPAGSGSSGGGGGTASTRLLLTARCHFHKPVLGPLRAQIERESLQGVRDAYSQLAPLLAEGVGAAAAAGGASGPGSPSALSNAASSSCMSSSLDLPEASDATKHAASSGGGGSAGSGRDRAYAEWLAARDRARRHLTDSTVDGVLEQMEDMWPEWTAGGCRLLENTPNRPAEAAAAGAAAADRPQLRAPSAAEAVAALRVLACRIVRLPALERRQLPKERVVRGLVQSLRLQGLSDGGATEQLAPAAVSRALWALSWLGGSIWYEAEAEALCSLLPNRPLRRLSQVEDAATALARMRHHTPHLALLEQWGAAMVQWQLEQAQAAAGLATEAAASSGSGSAHGGSSSGGEGGGGDAPIDHNNGCAGQPPPLTSMVGLIWALATLGHQPTRLLDLLPAVLHMHSTTGDILVEKRRLQRALLLGWSMAAAGCLSHPAVVAVAAELAAAAALLSPEPKVTKAQLLQLHQFVCALELEAEAAAGQPAAAASAAAEPPNGGSDSPPARALRLLRHEPAVVELRLRAGAAWEAEGGRRDNKRVSACQADVAATARGGLGLALQEEYTLEGISIDIAVRSRRLAIEVDGPTHFCRNSSQAGAAGEPAQPRPLGATLLKRRLILGQGWRVASINAADWEALRGADEKREALEAAIAAAESEQVAW
ncbi:hypothetical protein ABPG75_005855 [Micractinium tetrahymenae]